MIQLLTPTQVTEVLNSVYNAAIEKEPRILFLSIIGKANYGFAQKPDEILFTGYYLPTFEDICDKDKITGKEKVLHIPYKGVTYDIILASVKELPYDLMEGYSYQIEAFYSHFIKINEKYRKVYDKSFQNQPFLNAIQTSLYIKKHFISDMYSQLPKAPPATKNEYFQLMRSFTIVKMISQGKTYAESFRPTDDYIKYFLMDCLDTDPKVLDIVEITKTTKDQIREFYRNVPDSRPNDMISKLAHKGVVAILRDSFQSATKGVDFLDCLTTTEKMAYNEILARMVDDEAIISISKITNETNISRPVYKAVMQKMAQQNIATITNMGVKGTKITML